MFCPNCGKELKEGLKFCTNCGTSLAGVNVAAEAGAEGEESTPAEEAVLQEAALSLEAENVSRTVAMQEPEEISQTVALQEEADVSRTVAMQEPEAAAQTGTAPEQSAQPVYQQAAPQQQAPQQTYQQTPPQQAPRQQTYQQAPPPQQTYQQAPPQQTYQQPYQQQNYQQPRGNGQGGNSKLKLALGIGIPAAAAVVVILVVLFAFPGVLRKQNSVDVTYENVTAGANSAEVKTETPETSELPAIEETKPEETKPAVEEKKYPDIYDEGDIFSTIEEQQISGVIDMMKADTGWDIIVGVLENDGSGKSTEEKADDFYDKVCGIGTDGIAVIFNLEKGEYYVSTSGEAADAISDERRDEIIDAVKDYMKNGDYVTAANTLVTLCAMEKASQEEETEETDDRKYGFSGDPELDDSLWLADFADADESYFDNLDYIYSLEPLQGDWEVVILGDISDEEYQKPEDVFKNSERLAIMSVDVENENEGTMTYYPYKFLAGPDIVQDDSGYTIEFDVKTDGGILECEAEAYAMECYFWNDGDYQHGFGYFYWPDGEESFIIFNRGLAD